MAGASERLAQARAYLERVLMSLRDELPRMSDPRAALELEDALSVLDQAGYIVEGRSARRGTLAAVEAELSAAIDELSGREHRVDRDRLATAGRHVETALQHLRWRVKTPRSPVLERVVAIAAVAAARARPLREAINRVGDDLPSGPVNAEAEARRAVETAFASAVRWLPLAATAAGDEESGVGLVGLQGSQASYLAEFLRAQAGFPDAARPAVAAAASALDAAVRLPRAPAVDEAVAVSEEAAQVMRILVELRSPNVVDELRWLVNAAGDWPLRLPLRDLS